MPSAEADVDTAALDHVYAFGDVGVRTGAGDDVITLDNITAYKSLNVDAGAGNDRIEGAEGGMLFEQGQAQFEIVEARL